MRGPITSKINKHKFRAFNVRTKTSNWQQSDNPPFALKNKNQIVNYGNQMQIIVLDENKVIMKIFENMRLANEIMDLREPVFEQFIQTSW